MFGPERDIELLKNFAWEDLVEDPKWRAEQLAYHYFFWTLLFLESQKSVTIDGCSFSQRGRAFLLVVRATIKGIPQVAYTTEKSPTGCVRTFCRAFLEERVKWHKDKFRQI